MKLEARKPFTSAEACARKEWFRGEAAAWHEALKLRKERGYPATLQPYLCNQCGRWHIGNWPPRDERLAQSKDNA